MIPSTCPRPANGRPSPASPQSCPAIRRGRQVVGSYGGLTPFPAWGLTPGRRGRGSCGRRSRGLLGLGGEPGVHDGGLCRLDLLEILVRPQERFFVKEHLPEAVGRGLLVVVVHLDRVKRADVHADPARHADRGVDVKLLWQRASVGLERAALLILRYDDVDACRGALLLADFAGDTPEVVGCAVIDEERKVAE